MLLKIFYIPDIYFKKIYFKNSTFLNLKLLRNATLRRKIGALRIILKKRNVILKRVT